MINRVEKFLDEYVKSGSDIITFHLEIDENINNLIKKYSWTWSKVWISHQTKNTLGKN